MLNTELPPEEAVLLRLEDVRLRLGGVAVLNGASAGLKAGEITVFIGPNGAGKTTLFHVIAGELRPDSGRVLYEGRDIGGLSPWRVARLGIGRIFQDARIFLSLSPLDNVAAALLAAWDEGGVVRSLWRGGQRIKEARQQAEELLDRVGVAGRRDAPAAELSWGNQKLLAFARLLAGGFRVVLLDEPVSGVSPALSARLAELTRDMARQQGMLVASFVEHDMGFVREVADRVVVLRDGAIFACGDTAKVLTDPAVMELCLGL
jgi:branched-chain amino acid transport system ATP-binding protein